MQNRRSSEGQPSSFDAPEAGMALSARVSLPKRILSSDGRWVDFDMRLYNEVFDPDIHKGHLFGVGALPTEPFLENLDEEGLQNFRRIMLRGGDFLFDYAAFSAACGDEKGQQDAANFIKNCHKLITSYDGDEAHLAAIKSIFMQVMQFGMAAKAMTANDVDSSLGAALFDRLNFVADEPLWRTAFPSSNSYDFLGHHLLKIAALSPSGARFLKFGADFSRSCVDALANNKDCIEPLAKINRSNDPEMMINTFFAWSPVVADALRGLQTPSASKALDKVAFVYSPVSDIGTVSLHIVPASVVGGKRLPFSETQIRGMINNKVARSRHFYAIPFESFGKAYHPISQTELKGLVNEIASLNPRDIVRLMEPTLYDRAAGVVAANVASAGKFADKPDLVKKLSTGRSGIPAFHAKAVSNKVFAKGHSFLEARRAAAKSSNEPRVL